MDALFFVLDASRELLVTMVIFWFVVIVGGLLAIAAALGIYRRFFQ